MFDKKINYKDIQTERNLKDIAFLEAVHAETGEKIIIEYVQYLKIGQVSAFVETVMDSLMSISDTYLGEHKGFIIDKTFLNFYTNVELPKDIQECNLFVLENEPLIEELKLRVNATQWYGILNEISRRENVLYEKAVRQNDDVDSLAIGLNVLVSKLNDLIYTESSKLEELELHNVLKNLSKLELNQTDVINTIIGNQKGKLTKKKSNKAKDKADIVQFPSKETNVENKDKGTDKE